MVFRSIGIYFNIFFKLKFETSHWLRIGCKYCFFPERLLESMIVVSMGFLEKGEGWWRGRKEGKEGEEGKKERRKEGKKTGNGGEKGYLAK